MGQKVSPVGFRIGIIRDWESRWYAEKEYGTLLLEDIKIREYIFKNLKAANVSRVEIERSKNRVEVLVRAARPAVIIGQEGAVAKTVKAALEKLTVGKTVHLRVLEIANPDLDATIVARKIAEQLEQRASFRTAQKKAIQATMRAGAKGIKTMVSGRLGGNDIARSEGYAEGIVPLHTLRSDIDFSVCEAATTYGRLGVKVWICRGEVLPGQMVKEPEAPKNTGFDRDKKRRDNRGDRPAAANRDRRPRTETAAAPATPATEVEGGK
ncbi:MAG: 30S ribosomal protein S3 [Firmicutes bacterium GWF2_51_9]|jgi:small subunit ribosomal protein S3|nr:MAG: 30S ribosomal protein S3 [Firmicutes bacterium GWF2_51_9]OGS58980.1 MAG: 30S ribosomal protein S3 [Firmicutes bacterium GWE2_51_13]HAO61920.1 30S ribosomal protein S3 [Erysipelotrichaceae bacterium]HBZ40556.1 30S ribosomal protein S3 [Erysipelotrichaceae bacterium]